MRFIDEILDHASKLSQGTTKWDLSLDLWKPRFKKIGKTYGFSEWIKEKSNWKKEWNHDFTAWEVSFLEIFLVEKAPDLFKKIKAEAKRHFQIFFEGEDKRIYTRYHSLSFPAPETQEWEITISDGTYFGPVVVITMDGWEIKSSVLVG